MSGKGKTRPIDDLWRDGDWYADAWFLKQLDGIEARRGRSRYTHKRLVELAEVLLKLFPPEVCRAQLARPSGGAHFGGLFFNSRGHLLPLLELAELVLCAGSIPARLRTRLARVDEFRGAQLELELLAAARLAGLPVDHEPLGEVGPDLRVCHNHREYFVETKLLDQSDVAARAEEIERDLSFMLVQRVTDRAVSVHLDAGGGDPLLLDGRGRTMIDEVEVRARAECEEFIASGFESRRISIDGVGTLYVDAPEGNWASVRLFRLECDEYDSERAMRLVRDAAEQLPARGRRIIVVAMAHEADVEDAARLYKGRAAMRAPYYGNVDLVAFLCGDTKVRIVATPGEQISKPDYELIDVLTQPMPPERAPIGHVLLL